MTEVSRSNYPGKSWLAVADEPLVASPVKVRELQRALWTAAKQCSCRRFNALYDRICRGDVLWEAWERVRQNKGAAGVDRITLVAVEDYGVDRMLRELRHHLKSGRYRPALPRPHSGDGWFAADLRRAGLPAITVHDLRRTCASLAVSAGVNVLALQRMLGHASAKVALDVHADLSGADLDDVAINLDVTCAPQNMGTSWAHTARRQATREPPGRGSTGRIQPRSLNGANPTRADANAHDHERGLAGMNTARRDRPRSEGANLDRK